MDLRKIKKLIELLEDSSLAEIEIAEGDDSIRLSRLNGAVTVSAAAPGAGVSPGFPATAPAPAAVVSTPDETSGDTDAAPAGHKVESPTVGTYYGRPNPEAEPFVSVGQSVSAGETLCIVEAMKTFNEIQADKSGTISAVMKDDGDPVEYGETLFVIS